MCCCPSKVCCLCSCLVLVVIVLGLIFGFGIFQRGFDKIKGTFHECAYSAGGCGRPFIGSGVPAPY